MKLALVILTCLVLVVACAKRIDCDVQPDVEIKTIHDPTLKELREKVIPKAEVACRF
tara:strand:- start:275 stop:445 length:171 start_codon:yes stop_codon:yes gene_type:complete